MWSGSSNMGPFSKEAEWLDGPVALSGFIMSVQ